MHAHRAPAAGVTLLPQPFLSFPGQDLYRTARFSLTQTDIPEGRGAELPWTTALLLPTSQLEDGGLDKAGLILKETGFLCETRTHFK